MAAVSWRVVPLALAVTLAAGGCTAGPAGRAPHTRTFPAATAGRISAYLDGLAARGMLTGTVLVTSGVFTSPFQTNPSTLVVKAGEFQYQPPPPPDFRSGGGTLGLG